MAQRALPAVLRAALCCALFPWAASAQTDEHSGVYGLGEVIVVTGKSKGVQATQAVSTVTAEDIRSSGARTLDQAISLLPGVNVRVGGEGIPRIDIRGFRTRHVLLLLDGIPINSALDAQFDPTLIPTENIARIRLTEGASSVLYGQGGLGGVIDIITMKGSGGVHAMVAGETGDHQPYLGRASVSGAQGALDYFVSGSSTRQNAFPLGGDFAPTSLQPAGYRDNSDRRRTSVLGNIGLAAASDVSLGLTASYSQGQFGKPGSVISDQFDPFAAQPRFERITDFDAVSAQLAADYQATRQLRLRGWAFVNHLSQQDNRYDNGAFSTVNLKAGSFQSRVRTTIAGGALRPSYNLGGAGVLGFLLSAERDGWVNSGFLTQAQDTFSSLHQSAVLGVYSAAVEYELSPLPGLGLVAGYGHHWQSRVGGPDEDDYSALASAYCDLSGSTRLKASFQRNIRFPSLGDLYDPDPTRRNPSLVAERAVTYGAGVEQKLPLDSVASLNAFYTLARNLIQTDQATGQNTNLAELRFQGFEVSAATRPAKALLLRGSYTYLDSEDRSRAGRQEQQYTPRDKVALEGRYVFTFGLEPQLSLLYVGGQYYYTRNNVTPPQKGRLGDYALVNVKVSQRLLRDGLTVHLGVSNLLDRNYETSYGFPQAGRFVYGGIELRI